MTGDEWTIIHSYSRKEAIRDGVLIDVTEAARRTGFKYPVALTTAAWSECVVVPEWLEALQSETGRLWEVLWLLREAVTSGEGGAEVYYVVHVRVSPHWEDGTTPVTLRAVCGPDDDGSPCITVMLEGED